MSVCVLDPPLWLCNIVFSHACACACGAADCASCCARVQPIKVHTGTLTHSQSSTSLALCTAISPFFCLCIPPSSSLYDISAIIIGWQRVALPLCVSYWIVAVEHRVFCWFVYFCIFLLLQIEAISLQKATISFWRNFGFNRIHEQFENNT